MCVGAYRGASTITLAQAGIERGFPTGEWATYRQCGEFEVLEAARNRAGIRSV